MKRITTSAIFIFALAGARGASAQTMGFNDFRDRARDSESDASGSGYSRLIPVYTSGGVRVADSELAAEVGDLPDDVVSRALEGVKLHRVLPPPAVTTASADSRGFIDSSSLTALALSPDAFAVELDHESVNINRTETLSLTFGPAQTVELTGPLDAGIMYVTGQSDGPWPDFPPDCVLLKGSGRASGDWFQMPRSR